MPPPTPPGEVSFRVKVTEAAVKDDENNTIVNQADVKVGNNDPKQTTTTETYVPEKSITKYSRRTEMPPRKCRKPASKWATS